MLNQTGISKMLKNNQDLLDRYAIKTISVFGSIARGEAVSKSDIDLLVEFHPEAKIGLFEFISLKDELSDIFGMPVDLATPDSLHPAIKNNIIQEAIHVI